MPVTDKPWDGSAGRWPNAAAYAASCLIDLNPPGKPKTKELAKLPVREPDGTINRNAVHAAASILAGGRGGVDAPAEAKAAAASKIVAMYRRDLKEEPPDSLVKMAGGSAMNRMIRSAARR